MHTAQHLFPQNQTVLDTCAPGSDGFAPQHLGELQPVLWQSLWCIWHPRKSQNRLFNRNRDFSRLWGTVSLIHSLGLLLAAAVCCCLCTCSRNSHTPCLQFCVSGSQFYHSSLQWATRACQKFWASKRLPPLFLHITHFELADTSQPFFW